MSELMFVENGSKVGHNYSTSRWFPHRSLEGGTDTIGYGHKLTSLEQDKDEILVGNQRVSLKNGLTNRQIIAVFIQDVKTAEGYVRKYWDIYYGGRIPYNSLDEKYKGILVDVQYNTGNIADNFKWKWPKLANAILDGDDEKVRQESLRYYYDKLGTKIPLTGRTRRIADVLGLGF